MLNDSLPQKDIWNYQAGLRLYQVARSHACYWTYQAFSDEIDRTKDENIKEILRKVCLLFGINSVFENIEALIESGVLNSSHISSLKLRKEILLKQLRPLVSGLI